MRDVVEKKNEFLGRYSLSIVMPGLDPGIYVLFSAEALMLRHCEELLRRSNPDYHRGRFLDCFAEPVIGPRSARIRWLAITS
jgi:hypothetical protein